MRLSLRLLLACTLIAACSSSTSPLARVRVQPDVSTVPADSALGYSVHNGFAETILISRCGDRILPELERFVSGRWENAAAAVCQANMPMAPLELQPGETVVSSVRVGLQGDYRIVISYGRGTLRILYRADSPPFTVR